MNNTTLMRCEERFLLTAPPNWDSQADGSGVTAASYRVRSAGTQVNVDGVTYAEGQKVPADTKSGGSAHWLNAVGSSPSSHRGPRAPVDPDPAWGVEPALPRET